MWFSWQSACLAGTEPWVLVPRTAEKQEWWQSLVIPAHSVYVGRGLSSNLSNVSFKGVSYLTLAFLNTLPHSLLSQIWVTSGARGIPTFGVGRG